ncbi:uncharacterized protein M421DRAFT_344297 [Didymella exigua CBS 183.55]|uniref:Uncharacterized protein n=1 Tax=Didymella exigua CBS 183.55 TaxID=1150837 RepID=A0A6A5RVC6_9PLEO|nr:uncharacterized protein M421DRAFT_344297 [Didymella exigua CBS 183.55]KAF1931310.1 hypothetical protein M421DRAFT_344297 [Didymella exigua CBS 183.55]
MPSDSISPTPSLYPLSSPSTPPPTDPISHHIHLLTHSTHLASPTTCTSLTIQPPTPPECNSSAQAGTCIPQRTPASCIVCSTLRTQDNRCTSRYSEEDLHTAPALHTRRGETSVHGRVG